MEARVFKNFFFHTVFYADYIYPPLLVVHTYEPSGWLSTEVIAFKILRSCPVFKNQVNVKTESACTFKPENGKMTCIIAKKCKRGE